MIYSIAVTIIVIEPLPFDLSTLQGIRITLSSVWSATIPEV